MKGPSLRSWITAMVVGGGLALLLDPQAGRRRRAVLMDKINSLTQRGSQAATGTVQKASGTVAGIVTERVPHRCDNPNPDDVTLKDRIESEAFRDSPLLRGKLNINVAQGIVEVRGQLDSKGEIDEVIAAIHRVPDVGEVHSYLHLPGTPAPNKEEAIQASK